MSEWRTVRVRQELLEAVERTLKPSQNQSVSQFVSEAIQMHLDELKKKRERTFEKSIEYPTIRDRLLYSSHHMWAMVTPEGNIRVGVSDYAQKLMDEISSVQISQIGSQVQKEKPFGLVETWMFKFELHSPVTGKIIRLNKAIQEEHMIINKDPYEARWMAEIKPDNRVALEEELRELMKPEQYKTWVSKLQSRAKGI
jgi:glycine cleavage system H protein